MPIAANNTNRLDQSAHDAKVTWLSRKFVLDSDARDEEPYRDAQERFFDAYFSTAGVSGERILDFSCGNGHFTAKFARLGAEAVGVDTSDILIAQARKDFGELALFAHAANHQAMLGWLAQQASGIFDRIYISDALQSFTPPATGNGLEQAQIVTALTSLLRPGGLLHLMEPAAGQDINRSITALCDRGLDLTEHQHPGSQAKPDGSPVWDFITFRRRTLAAGSATQ